MAKIKPHQIDRREKYAAIDNLFEIISRLKTKKEVVEFFLGLFSASESLMLARRLQIAVLLLEGFNYEEIKQKLKVGNDNVRKVDQWLHDGNEEHVGWLNKTIKNSKQQQEEKKNRKINTGSPGSLLSKYPYHRFISKIFND